LPSCTGWASFTDRLLLSIVIALFGAILYGGADFLGGVATRRDAWLRVTIYAELIGLIPLGIVTPLVWPHQPSLASLGWGLAAGTVGAAGIALLYKGLGSGKMSVVAPITAVCATVIPVLAGLVLGDHPSSRSLVGVAVAVLAIVLVSQGSHGHGAGEGSGQSGVGIALASGFSIGGFLILIAQANGNGLWPLFVSRLAATGALIALALIRRQPLLPAVDVRATVQWCGVCDASATVCYALAVHPGALGIVATLISLYPATTIVLARLVLKEHLRRRQGVGLAFAAGAVLLITSG
jgi:drug/metabolite transporter (DMT)-like permease